VFVAGPGEALASGLADAGLTKPETSQAIGALMHAAHVKSFTQPVRVTAARLADACAPGMEHVVALTLTMDRPITAVRNAKGVFTVISETAETDKPIRVTGHVPGHDLSAALQDGGLPAGLADELLTSFASNSDVALNTTQDVKFDVLYQVKMAPGNVPVEAALTVASLSNSTDEHKIYYYRTHSGDAVPVDEAGNALTPASAGGEVGPQMFIHPLPDGKLTSPFGWRKHPVLHVVKFHNGIDYSAPRGTPVMAAADGTVEIAAALHNYGRMIRVQHDAHTMTTYAHLDSFAKGVKPGTEVHQGDVIGYVGRTGLASGNHLYFEILVDGHCVDPIRVEPELAGAPVAPSEPPRESVTQFVQLAEALRATVAAGNGGDEQPAGR
jgi:murein DD-endopeptidase MepM/ murein hydrolase activator NlpD